MGMSVPAVGRGTLHAHGLTDRTPDPRTGGSGDPGGGSFVGKDLYIPSAPQSPSFTPSYGSSPYGSPGAGGVAAPSGHSSQAVVGPSSAPDSREIGSRECTTCDARTYQDESNDPGVSFKSAAHVSPEAAASAVSTHEGEHVVREQLKAEADGNTVVRQNVQIHTAVCPECGRVYVSGGTTTTVTRSEPPTRRGRNIEIEV